MNSDNCSFCKKLSDLASMPAEELVWEFPHSIVLLGPWQYYEGYCIVVCKRHERELHHLPEDVRHGYFEEMVRVARVIEHVYHPLKLNYELLGNQVPHLHWHLFPRYEADANRLNPVWADITRGDTDEPWRARMRGKQERIQIVKSLMKGLSDDGARKYS